MSGMQGMMGMNGNGMHGNGMNENMNGMNGMGGMNGMVNPNMMNPGMRGMVHGMNPGMNNMQGMNPGMNNMQGMNPGMNNFGNGQVHKQVCTDHPILIHTNSYKPHVYKLECEKSPICSFSKEIFEDFMSLQFYESCQIIYIRGRETLFSLYFFLHSQQQLRAL